MNALATSDRPFPNEHGRRLREEHIRVLEASVDELHIALDDSELGTDSTDGYQRAVRELASLRSHLDSAGAIEDIPDDPRVVELGGTVEVPVPAGSYGCRILSADRRIPPDHDE